MERYERQARLEVWDQNVVASATVLVVGMGGTGCELSKNLALSGIGRLIIVDPDVIESSNLNRQFFYHERDVGKYKVTVAKRRLLTLNPHVTVETCRGRIQDVPMKLFEKADVVAGCVDNFLARQYINSRCVFYNKILVDSATDGYLGQVQVVIPGKTACLACHSPEPPDETRIVDEPCTLVGIPRKREHCAWKAYYQFFEQCNRPPREDHGEDVNKLLEMANEIAKNYHFPPFDRAEILEMLMYHVPSVSSVNALIAAIQTQELLKALFMVKKNDLKERPLRNLDDLLAKQRFRIPSLSIYAGLTSTFISYDLIPDLECPVCSEKNSASPSVIEARTLEEFRRLLKQKYGTKNLWINRNEMMYHLSEINHANKKYVLRDGELLTIVREEDGFEEHVIVKVKNVTARKSRKKP